MANIKKIEVTEELIALNPEVLKDAKIGDKVEITDLVLPEKKEEKEEVKIGKETLEKILKTMESLKEQNDSLIKKDLKRDEEIEMLKSVADVGRLNKYQAEKNGGELIRTARLGFYNVDGKEYPIIAWKTTRDEVGFVNGIPVAKQFTNIFLKDEEGKDPKIVEVDILSLSRNIIMKTGEVISTNSSKEGVFQTLQFKDGLKVTVEVSFLNRQ